MRNQATTKYKIPNLLVKKTKLYFTKILKEGQPFNTLKKLFTICAGSSYTYLFIGKSGLFSGRYRMNDK